MESQIVGSFRFALDVALKATFLFALTGLSLLLLRRRSAAARHLVGTAGLAAALLFPLFAPLLPRVEVPLLPAPAGATRAVSGAWSRERARVDERSEVRGDAVERMTLAPDRDAERSPAIPSHLVAKARAAGYGDSGEKTPTRPRFVLAVPAMAAMLGIWLGGAAVLLARLLVGLARVRRCRRHATKILSPAWTALARNLGESVGVRAEVPLFFSDALPVAVTSGLRHPVLLFPRGAQHWDFGRRRVVLLHELAHIARRDWPALLLAETAAALYWFHPLVWVLSRRLRRDGERAADDRVLAAGTKPSVYAGHLLGIIRSLKPAPHRALPVMGMARPSHFEERLRAILDPQMQRRRLTSSQIRFAAVGLFAAAGGAAMFQPWAPQCASASVAADLTAIESSTPARKTHDFATCPMQRERKNPKSNKSGLQRSTVRAGDAIGAKSDAVARRIERGIQEGITRGISYGIERGVAEGVSEGVEQGVTSGVEAGVISGIEKGLSAGIETGVSRGLEAGARAAVPGFVKASHLTEESGREAYRRARELHEKERYAEAATAFRSAYAAGYRRDLSAYNAACAYARAGNREQAWEWLAKSSAEGFSASSRIGSDDDLESLRSDPRLAELRASLKRAEAGSHRGSDEAARAVDRFERLARQSPENGEEWYGTGKKLLAVGRYDLAERAFRLAARSKYRVGASLYNTACALALAGNRAEALDLLQQALESGFDDPKLIRTDSDLDAIRSDPRYRELLQMAEALELRADGDSFWKKAESFIDGNEERERARWMSAARRYDEAAKHYPQLGRAWFNLGYARLGGGDAQAALNAFEKALALGYRRPTVTYNIACSYARLGRKDEAFSWLFQALDAGFDGEEMLRHDADLKLLRGDARFGEALKLAEKRK